MADVIWSGRALRRLSAITEYIAWSRPKAAEAMSNRLVAAAQSLADNPLRGRPISHGQRELTIVWPYLIRYIPGPDAVRITDICHGARRPSRRS